MRIKSYFTNTVEAAVSLARVELGSEALLVSVRRTTGETKAFGNYEVVFGLAAPEKGPANAAVPVQPERPQAPPPAPSREPRSPRFTFSEKEVERRPLLGAPESESRFEIARSALMNPQQPCIAALVGPHGAGKTSTLVKLAVIQGLAAGRPVEIISLDTQRVGASEALRSYATALNVGFYPLDNPALLPHAIEDLKERNNLILIDTPGYGKDSASLAGLAKALGRRQDVESHLVVPATLGHRELRRAVDRFTFLKPASLLFTRTDETASFGRIVNEAFRTKIPLSFFGSGPEIPEDLEIVTQQSLADRVAGRRSEEALSAA